LSSVDRGGVQDGHADTTGEFSQCSIFVIVFVCHYESDNIATGTAAEALKGLSINVHCKCCALLIVKWAARPVPGSVVHKREVRSDYFQNVVRSDNRLGICRSVIHGPFTCRNFL
jgi:hypothetical protein